MMGPEYSKIAIGISAATGVVLVSFLLLKKFGYHDKSNTREDKVGDGVQEEKTFALQENVEQFGTTNFIEQQGRNNGELQGTIDKVFAEEKNNLLYSVESDGQNQQSFILINDEDIPENNLEGDLSTPGHAGKKSDRSSDESSYDVIENDRLDDHLEDEDVMVDESGKGALDNKTEEDVNLSSMIFVEESLLSGQDKSGSSLFVSADEVKTEESTTVDTTENQGTPYVGPDKETPENVAVTSDVIKMEDVSENNSSCLPVALEDSRNETKEEVPLVDALVSQEFETLEKDSKFQDDDFKSQEEVFKIQDNTLDDNFKSPGDTLDDDFKSLDDNSKPLDEIFKTQDDDFKSQGDDFKSQGDDFKSQDDDFKSQDDDFKSQGDDFKSQDDDFKSQDDDIKSQDDDFKTLDEDSRVIGNISEEIAKVPVIDIDSKTLDIQKATEVLFSCQNNPGSVTQEEIVQLVELLSKNNPSLQATILDSLVKVTAFTQNINYLLASGCPDILVQQIKDLVSSQDFDQQQLISICNVFTNLSLDPKIQQQLGDVVPVLTQIVKVEDVNQTLLLSALRSLVNLSSESVHHNLYRDVISTLYSMLCTGSQTVKVLSVKVLVNLSRNSDFVQDLLTAKAPASFVTLLDSPPSDDLVLRCITMLSNLYIVICTTTDLNPKDTTSQETMLSILTNENNKSTLRAKALHLTKHDDEDLRYEATKLYNFLS